jgi:hypothetical protein
VNENSPGITEQPLFTLELADEIGTFAPRTTEDLRTWLDAEAQAWRWLQAIPGQDSAISHLISRQYAQEQDINHYVSAFENDAKRRDELMPLIAQRLQNRYNEKHALHSASPRAKYIFGIVAKDPRVAAHTAWALMGEHSEPNRPGMMGAALAADFLFGPQSPPEAFSTSWAEVRGTIQKKHAELLTAAGAANDAWHASKANVENLYQHQQTEFKTMEERRANTFNAKLEQHSEKLAQLEDTFKKNSALRASVQYFNARAKSHSFKAGVFTFLALLVGVFTVWGAVEIARTVFTDKDNKTIQPTNVQIALAIICGFLLLWLLRLLVRVLLSNLHLATDLRNRATLVQAYLSLILEGGALQDSDRSQIIALVFRPVGDGLVRDDGAPPNAFSAAQDLLSGRTPGRG